MKILIKEKKIYVNNYFYSKILKQNIKELKLFNFVKIIIR